MGIQTTYKKDLTNIEEINVKYILNLFIRNKKFISFFTLISFIISIIISQLSKKIWEGEFQIVLGNSQASLNKSIFNQTISNFVDINNLGKATTLLNTELEILRSPSVLMPVFEFVKNEKKLLNTNSENLLFSNWAKSNLDVNLIKGTSVLSLKYKDIDKDIIIPVLNKITGVYQEYSGKNRKRNIALTIQYLNEQINEFSRKSTNSFQRVQEYAIQRDLINQFNSESSANLPSSISTGSLLNIEKVRVNAANKIRNIERQIQQIEELKDFEQLQYIGSTIPGLQKTGLPSKLEALETQIANYKGKYTAKDKIFKSLIEERNLLTTLLKQRSIGYLKAAKLETEALKASASRPKSVLIKYKELIRKAARDEKTLINLENQLNLLKLEEARLQDPWELITEATLMPIPTKLRGKKFVLLITSISIIFSYLLCLIFEKRKGLVYEKSLIEEILNTKIIDEINLKKGTYKKYNKNIVQNEILNIETKNPVKVLISESFDKQESLESLKLIFDNTSSFEIISSLNNLNEKNKVILILKFSSINLKELNSIKERFTLQRKQLNGIFIVL